MAPNFRLDGRVALVTGASSGIGRHLAETLAEAGAAVAVTARRADRLHALVEGIRAKGGKAHAHPADLARTEGYDAILDDAERNLGLVDILINNAGLNIQKPLVAYTPSDYDTVVGTNLKSPLFLAQAVAKRLIAKGKGGSIINVASLLAQQVLRQVALYAASKAGLVHLTRVMALEWARHDIRVNAILPGYIETELNDVFFASDKGKALIDKLPRKRLERLEDLDGLVLVLASDAGKAITGAALLVDDAQQFGMS